AFPQDDVEHRHVDGQVHPGADGQVEVGVARDGGHARVGHHELAAVVAAAPDVLGGDGGALGDVGPGHEQDLRLRNVAPGVRRAVDVEGELEGRARGHHA